MQPITIVLSQGFSDWEIAPLAGAGRAFFSADIRFASPGGGALTSAAGLTVAATEPFTAPDTGVVVICGGPVWESTEAPDMSQALRRAIANGCVVAGICGGTVPLAKAGLLDHVAHTSNAPDYLAQLAPGYTGAAHYRDQPAACRDGHVITAPAPAPASFAAEVLMAAGLEPEAARQLPAMLAREHL
ncbi:MAG TPA: DJ-1/PfpI family protein [Devosia sp.]|jgi:putative intracellular protease/amidase|nr:DJ-1/PfpI family protein [Devosia sp.]